LACSYSIPSNNNFIRFKTFLLLLSLIITTSCTFNKNRGGKLKKKHLFKLLDNHRTNINFNNSLSVSPGINRNVLMYEYFYNGGGIAVGDINNDNLPDIYFTGNMSYNRLYLNQGDMKFKDITIKAGVAGRKNTWKTGVTMADVNGDGLLDIYVSYSGQLPKKKRIDELYINQGINKNGIPIFKEESKQFGLAIPHSTTNAIFFDYDKDNDLDLLLLGHNVKSLPILNKKNTKKQLHQNDPMSGVRLFKNENNHFKDITKNAGLNSSPLTYCLGAGILDINNDGWPDIYIGNDYSVPDYLYINNGNGTFSDSLKKYLGHTSYASMGIDIADYNNDGQQDIFVLDMLPEDNHRQKTLNIPNNRDQFKKNVDLGFHYQYMRNMLQLNNGNGTFSEIGQLAGISNTDWSWAPLVADYDNDGWKDLFITNGIPRDFTDRDFIDFINSYEAKRDSKLSPKDVSILLRHLSSTNLTNYFFKNNGDLTFSDFTRNWGIKKSFNSNGASYADLDNDGDLDFITNNINQPASIFENKTSIFLKNHYLKIRPIGAGKNTYGIGARFTIYTNGNKQYLEQMPTRGYLSSVSPILHFGLGKRDHVDSLMITWGDGKKQILRNLKADQTLKVKEKNNSHGGLNHKHSTQQIIFKSENSPINFKHRIVGNIDDFERQPLMTNSKSFVGPVLKKADVNGDQLVDIFVGGGYGQTSAIFLQQPDGTFIHHTESAFQQDKNFEDIDAVFFDANGDGAEDLYIASGGYDNFKPKTPSLQDRLYLNDGEGNFAKIKNALPQMFTSTITIAVNDINEDGLPDLFIGGGIIPGRYPEIPTSYLLINNGKGHFEDRTSTMSTKLQKIGMITDAIWQDLNNDSSKELIIAGNWMPIKIFGLKKNKLVDQTDNYFKRNYSGLWNKLLVDDFNNDGYPDIVAGNFGLNSQLHADFKHPAKLFYNDFDKNGSIDPILNFYIQGKSYPFVTLDELNKQLNMTKTRFQSYNEYADATIKDVLTKNELSNAKILMANHLKTTLFLSNKTNTFKIKELPIESQFSPIFSIIDLDFNGDGNKDLLIGGNMNEARIRFGKYDANYGVALQGDGNGNFSYVPQYRSGLKLRGDVRSMVKINKVVLFGINRRNVRAYSFQE